MRLMDDTPSYENFKLSVFLETGKPQRYMYGAEYQEIMDRVEYTRSSFYETCENLMELGYDRCDASREYWRAFNTREREKQWPVARNAVNGNSGKGIVKGADP